MIETVLYTVASAADHAPKEAGSTDILGALGIDVQLLIFQLVAFLILVFVLGKWILPVFIKIVDEREAKIASGIEAAHAAEKKAAGANDDIDAMLKEARKEAKDIVATAKEEATAMTEAADKKAKERAEHLLSSAQDEIEKQTLAAKKELHNHTLDLLAVAVEKVIGKADAAAIDTSAMKQALEGAKKEAR